MQNSLTKKLGLTVATIAMAATSIFTTTDAEAVPSFARQTGMTCNSCHFQSFPALNGMGRSFRAGGYTMKGIQTSIESENMDLPSNLNMAIIWKNLYKTAKTGYEVGESAWADETVFFAAGRVGQTTGYLFELGMGVEGEGEVELSGEAETKTVTIEGTQFANSKVAFNVAQSGSINFAVIPWVTDIAGPDFAMEFMNTASQKSQRVIEDRKAMSPIQSMGMYSAGTGISFNASDMGAGWSATYTLWGPVHNGGNVNLSGMASRIRVHYFMDLAGFDTGFAFGSNSGEVAASSDGGKTQNYNIAVGGSNIDFQMQGQIAGNDFGFYLQQATAGDATGVAEVTATSTTTTSKAYGMIEGGGSGLGFVAKYSATPTVHVHYASNSHTVGADSTASAYSSMGVNYLLDENIRIQLFQSTSKVGDADASSHQTLGWFIGF